MLRQETAVPLLCERGSTTSKIVALWLFGTRAPVMAADVRRGPVEPVRQSLPEKRTSRLTPACSLRGGSAYQATRTPTLPAIVSREVLSRLVV